MSPIKQSRFIVEFLTDNEFLRKQLHTLFTRNLSVEDLNKLFESAKGLAAMVLSEEKFNKLLKDNE